jgi:hypothetical protein
MMGTLSPRYSLTFNFTSTAFRHVSFDENCLPMATLFVTGKSQQFQGFKFECRIYYIISVLLVREFSFAGA